jgi:hypothetical protein
MPRPSSKLDLLVLPSDPDRELAGPSEDWFDLGLSRRWWDEDGAAGEAADQLVQGGFRSMMVSDDQKVRFFANQLGGFQVLCPDRGTHIIPSFSAAMTQWRAGGPRVLARCGACGATHALETLHYRPPAAFGRRVLRLIDVQRAAIESVALQWMREAWGEIVVVGRRPH